MDNTEINIPDISFKKDFTIIYKGRDENKEQNKERIEEIKTSRDEFLRKLRYFKQRKSEISQMNEIFIHDSYSVEIFKKFVNSLETRKIEVNDSNYQEISKLSQKYEYHELNEELTTFSNTRPDIQRILDTSKKDELDSLKEEKLSKNLDICLQNQNFIKLPLPVLARILNSPKRVLHDHHLLLEFIRKIINEYKINEKNNKNNKEIEEENRSNLQVLLSCIDLSEMSNDELDEFLNNDEMTSIFNHRHSKERMKTLCEENKKNEKKQNEMETRIKSLEEKFIENQKQFLEEIKNRNIKIEEMSRKISKQEKTLSEYHTKNAELQKVQQTQENKIKILEKQNQDIENLKNKLIMQGEILSKYQKQNDKLQNLLSEQEKKLRPIDEKYRLKSSISVKVESDQTIKGTINIIEQGNKLDKSRSKYILNSKNTRKLGEIEYRDGTNITNLKQNISYISPAGTYFLHALIVDEFGNSEELVSDPLITKGVKFKFDFTGRVQSAKLNPGTYKLEVWGSSGGENNKSSYDGTFSGTAGRGGYSSGTLTLKKETTLYVYVGGCAQKSIGGWNGGGSSSPTRAGGGGSTDISLYGEEGSTEWNTADHMYSRIIVAGGGGGSSHTSYPDRRGGSGGGKNGENNGDNEARGGTKTSGYAFGIGETSKSGSGSGAGGGWYGGYTDHAHWPPGGGGGSGFVYNSSTATHYPSGCRLDSSFYLTNSATISGSANIPTTSGAGTERGHVGNGYAIITPIIE